MTNPQFWRTLLDAWQLGPIRTLVQPETGTINEIVRVVTADGDYYLRAYRHPERAPFEHAAIAHARSRGLPAIGPCPLPDGTTLLERDGRCYALFPQARVSVHVLWGKERQNTVLAVGRSIIDRSSTADIGEVMLGHGGGGHPAAGTCQVPHADTARVLAEVIAAVGAPLVTA